MSYLVDSDWVIDFLRGVPAAGTTLFALQPEGLAISLITLGEVLEGVIYGRGSAAEETALEELLQDVDLIPLTPTVMRRFATIRGDLRRRGQIIGDLDILIAATALEHGLTLITRNRRDFGRIADLLLYEAP